MKNFNYDCSYDFILINKISWSVINMIKLRAKLKLLTN